MPVKATCVGAVAASAVCTFGLPVPRCSSPIWVSSAPLACCAASKAAVLSAVKIVSLVGVTMIGPLPCSRSRVTSVGE